VAGGQSGRGQADLTQCCETGRVFSRMRGKSSNEVYVRIKRCTIDPYI